MTENKKYYNLVTNSFKYNKESIYNEVAKINKNIFDLFSDNFEVLLVELKKEFLDEIKKHLYNVLNDAEFKYRLKTIYNSTHENYLNFLELSKTIIGENNYSFSQLSHVLKIIKDEDTFLSKFVDTLILVDKSTCKFEFKYNVFDDLFDTKNYKEYAELKQSLIKIIDKKKEEHTDPNNLSKFIGTDEYRKGIKEYNLIIKNLIFENYKAKDLLDLIRDDYRENIAEVIYKQYINSIELEKERNKSKKEKLNDIIESLKDNSFISSI